MEQILLTQSERDKAGNVEKGWGIVLDIDALLKAQIKKVLIGIGKESKRLDDTTYLIPDYTKYAKAFKEVNDEGES